MFVSTEKPLKKQKTGGGEILRRSPPGDETSPDKNNINYKKNRQQQLTKKSTAGLITKRIDNIRDNNKVWELSVAQQNQKQIVTPRGELRGSWA